MAVARYLVVNADDFGLSAGVNRGIIECYERGIVTSASLMVRWPSAVEAAAYGREHPDLGLGLHLDLGEWAYRHGTWVALYEVVPTDDGEALSGEIRRQMAEFERLLGRSPTHIDSHQHVHRSESVLSLVLEAASRLGIPVRHYAPEIRYCGEFYGQTGNGEPFPASISVDSLVGIITALPAGITELACHPGFDDGLDTMYGHERALEVVALCDPRVRATIAEQGIRLRSFSNLPGK